MVLSVELTSSTRLEIVVGELVAGIDDELGELLRAAGHHVEDRAPTSARSRRSTRSSRDRHHVLEVGGDLGEFVADVVGLEVERGGQPVAGGAIASRWLRAGGFEAVEQVAAALAERVDHGVAGVAERARDVLAFLGERVGDARATPR